MKQEIIENAADLFLTLGFKSVTMDDIAGNMGISKKTIYAHFPNKNKLVESATKYVVKGIEQGIEEIVKKDLNSIEEVFQIKKFVFTHLKDDKSSPQFQLQKFYPEVYKKVQKHHLDIIEECVRKNLQKGIDGGVFRPSIDVEFISKMNFLGMTGIKDNDIFPVEKYQPHDLSDKFLEYHLRAIVTPKGLQMLKEFLTIED